MNHFAGLGELLWDVLPHGKTLGGAPANFAFHVNTLGGGGLVFSRIGDDDLGREAMAVLGARGMDTSHVSIDPHRPTGTVLATLDAEGRASYTFPPDVAWDGLCLDERALALAAEVDGVCFGSLAQRSPVSRQAMTTFLRATRPDALRVFDVNLRQDFYSKDVIHDSLQLASVFKLSDEELPVVAQMLGMGASAGKEEAVLAELVRRYDLRLAALTCGGEGSLLVSPTQSHRHPGVNAELVDTIGAGDSFTAAMTLGLAAGWNLSAINERANNVAAAVCGQAGGMVPLPAALSIR